MLDFKIPMDDNNYFEIVTPVQWNHSDYEAKVVHDQGFIYLVCVGTMSGKVMLKEQQSPIRVSTLHQTLMFP